MKKLYLLLLLVFSIVLGSVSAQSVTICNGKYSKRYHTSADCRGLNNCKGGLSRVSLSEKYYYDGTNSFGMLTHYSGN